MTCVVLTLEQVEMSWIKGNALLTTFSLSAIFCGNAHMGNVRISPEELTQTEHDGVFMKPLESINPSTTLQLDQKQP